MIPEKKIERERDSCGGKERKEKGKIYRNKDENIDVTGLSSFCYG